MAVADTVATLEHVREKIEANERLDLEDGLALIESDDLLALGMREMTYGWSVEMMITPTLRTSRAAMNGWR